MIALIIFLVIVIWQMKAYKTSGPSYLTLKNDGAITIREYPSITIAQVQMKGDRYHCITSGFRLLASYIFGQNTENLKIAMTAPVMQTHATTIEADSMNTKTEDEEWIIRFIMPANHDKSNLPQPNNPQIKILSLSAKKYIVIRFSGSNTESNLTRHLALLKNYIQSSGLHTVGNPVYAFYNPPWILPFLRRNEIMFEQQVERGEVT